MSLCFGPSIFAHAIIMRYVFVDHDFAIAKHWPLYTLWWLIDKYKSEENEMITFIFETFTIFKAVPKVRSCG